MHLNTLNIKKTLTKPSAIDLYYDIIGGFLFAFAMYTFAENAGFAAGGVSGLALIIHHFTSLPLGTLSILLNVPIILLTIRKLGKQFLLRSIRSMLISSFFIDLVLPFFPQYCGDMLLASLFTGVFAGAGLGMIYMRGSSTGGSDFIVAAIKKDHPHLSFGTITLLVDGIIIICGAIAFGTINAGLCGGIEVMAATVVMDKLIYGAGSGKLILAVTDDGEKVSHEIFKRVERGCTICDATGAFSGNKKNLVYCACSNREVVFVRSAIFEADPSAMIFVCESSEQFGKGFQTDTN